ncbi:crosslink repair DNA glycosylase YcaQ family protein [Streptomyces sp. NPDC096040]|uniref:DNA glycosylase AlkZ-like family protein n=1 Tax=Streptomyces sp. NPDC096040 TaxID=3155541 RepID=UPI00331D499C
MANTSPGPILGPRALNRATLDRQLLLRRSPRSAKDAVAHLVGLQAQNVKPPYHALAARLDGFAPEQLSRLMADREVVRIVTLRSTIHTHTADHEQHARPGDRDDQEGHRGEGQDPVRGHHVGHSSRAAHSEHIQTGPLESGPWNCGSSPTSSPSPRSCTSGGPPIGCTSCSPR